MHRRVYIGIGMYTHVCIGMCRYVYIYIYIHIYMYIHLDIYIYIYIERERKRDTHITYGMCTACVSF